MTEWTTEWPTTKGWYWFYGWDFGRGRSGREEPTLYPVRIQKVSNGYMYVCEGYFIYKGQAEGLWLPITTPCLPDHEYTTGYPSLCPE